MMLSKNTLICLFRKHSFIKFTAEGARYRHCLRCGQTELIHYHPRRRRTNAASDTPLAVPVRVDGVARPYAGEGRSMLDRW